MSTRKLWVQLVSRLNRLTQEGQIRWTPRDAPDGLTAGTSEQVPIFFSTQHNRHNLAIYEERYQIMDQYEHLHWDTRIVLGFFDSDWRKLWELPSNVSGIHELYDSVGYQSSGVDEFIDSLEGDLENGDS